MANAESTPLVSVIVPTYNRSTFLARAINSVLQQTVQDFEIIVIDDGSTDGTEEHLRRFEEIEPRLKRCLVYEKQKNRGANAARNAGIRLARGEYIAFLDSDDLWHPRKLELQLTDILVREAVNPGNMPVFSFTGRFRVDAKYKPIALQFAGSMKGAMHKLKLSNSIGTLSSVMVTAWVAREVHGFDESLAACQDWDFYLRALPYCIAVGTREPLIMYYDGDITRISGNPRKRLLAHMTMYRRYLRDSLSEEELEELYRNLAEDLEGAGKRRWSRRFYLKHMYSKEGIEGLTNAAKHFLSGRTIREDRYLGYAQTLDARLQQSAPVSTRLLDTYEPLVTFNLDDHHEQSANGFHNRS